MRDQGIGSKERREGEKKGEEFTVDERAQCRLLNAESQVLAGRGAR